KRQVFGQVGIDMLAGPSEILVIADGRTPADWLAMDLFSQAEHDEAAQALLLSTQSSYLDQVELSMKRLLPAMPRREIIAASLEARGALIETRDLEEACTLANGIAPEHLELSVEDPQAWLPKLKHAGAIFLGRWSSEAIGDYCAGPNHVLPTAGSARFSSPLGVYDFQKRSSVLGAARARAARAADEPARRHGAAARKRLRRPAPDHHAGGGAPGDDDDVSRAEHRHVRHECRAVRDESRGGAVARGLLLRRRRVPRAQEKAAAGARVHRLSE